MRVKPDQQTKEIKRETLVYLSEVKAIRRETYFYGTNLLFKIMWATNRLETLTTRWQVFLESLFNRCVKFYFEKFDDWNSDRLDKEISETKLELT